MGATLLAGCSGESGDDTASETGVQDQTRTPTPTSTVPQPSFDPSPEEWTAPTDAPAEVSRNVLVKNLEIPWDIAVAPNGDLFVTERVGRVSRFTGDRIESVLAPEAAIDAESLEPGSDERPWWVKGGEGGTLGVAVHPQYPDVQVLFVYYTASVGGGKVNRVSRFRLDADDPGATETVIVDELPANKYHNGGRLTFGPKGYLWVTTGDAGQKSLAADPSSPAGKVLRVTVDGEPAPDNPGFTDGRVYTYGHRNGQGLAWTPDGETLFTEHGPSGKDEINRLVAGESYGWPDVRTGSSYPESDAHPPLANTGGDTWAPTGTLFYTGDVVDSWQNRLLIGGLISQQVIVATLTPPDAEPPPVGDGRQFAADWTDDAYTVTAHTFLTNELGRVRHLEQGPDGGVYAITSNRDGRANGEFPRDVDDVLVRLESK